MLIYMQIPTDDNYKIMKRSRVICAATDSGTVNLLDPNTLKVIKSFNKAHAAGISDMDTQNDLLVTCGTTQRPHQTYGAVPDMQARVFDLRMLRSLASIPFPAGAAYVRMHPKMTTNCIIGSQSGQLQVVDLMNPNNSTVTIHQADTISGHILGMELASSGDALVLSDADGSIHLWGSPGKVQFNELASPIEWPDEPSQLPEISWTPETLAFHNFLMPLQFRKLFFAPY
jgi:PAB-dependent poly(A)-specific ribonuclease subunit 2